MSYEYRLVFDDDSTAQHVMDVVQASGACVRAEKDHAYLKDKALNSNADYDARLTHEDEKSLWLEVNFKSPELYELVKKAISDRHYKCFEDGDVDDEIGLNEAFRIRNGY